MRALAPVALLLLAGLLAGCSGPGPGEAEAPADGDDGGDGGGDRTARPGRGSDYDEEDGSEDLQPVDLLQVPLQVSGQGPVSFDVEVPPLVEVVTFTFRGGPGFVSSGLRVDLSGCGSYGNGAGVSGSIGGTYWSELCGPADAGAQTVTVGGDLLVFDGTFILTGYVPSSGSTATARDGIIDPWLDAKPRG